MSAMGSLSEGLEFFASGAKPLCRFRDRTSAPRMAESRVESGRRTAA